MDFDAEPRPIYLLSVPLLARSPSSPFLAGLLLPVVLVTYVLVLTPRLLLVMLLLIVRFLMAGFYSSSQLPIIGILLYIPALLLFGLFGLIRSLFLQLLLDWNLALSGMDDSDRQRYVTLIVGPVVGPHKQKPLCTLHGSGIGITNGDVYGGVIQALTDEGLTEEADEFDAQWDQLSDTFTGEEFAQAVKKLAERYVRIRVV